MLELQPRQEVLKTVGQRGSMMRLGRKIGTVNASVMREVVMREGRGMRIIEVILQRRKEVGQKTGTGRMRADTETGATRTIGGVKKDQEKMIEGTKIGVRRMTDDTAAMQGMVTDGEEKGVGVENVTQVTGEVASVKLKSTISSA